MGWNKITLVGVGLLGGSLGMALRKGRLSTLVAGYVRRESSVHESVKHGAVEQATTDLQEAVRDADLIILCTPIAQMSALVSQMRSALKRGAIITDVGSVKGSVARELEPLTASTGAHFVGSHPMAGAEKTGVAAARADLFQNAVCVVTPTPNSSAKAVREVKRMWKSVGARLLTLSPEAHDVLVSRSSHLPHMLAAQLTHLVLDPKHPPEQKLLCANGFRDTTRIASGSPEMWRDIAISNRQNLAKGLDIFIRELTNLKKSLRKGDSEAMMKFFTAAKERRDAWVAKATASSPE